MKRSWWVFGFALLVYFLGLQSFQKKHFLIANLQDQVRYLSVQKSLAQKNKEELQQQILSQQDPAYVELMLMKKLGVVPDGHVKIRFKKSDHDSTTIFEEY